jgi:hypothetical protein
MYEAEACCCPGFHETGGQLGGQILLDQEQVLQFPVIGEIIRNMGANMPHTR